MAFPTYPNLTLDLTTLAEVKSWLSSNGTAPVNSSDDTNVAACITYFSLVFLWRTGLGPQDGSIPTNSPFLAPVSYTDVYDGSGSSRLFLHNYPIQSVTNLQIENYIVPASSGWGSAGYVIDGSKKSLSIRGGGGGNSVPFNFWTTCGGAFFAKGIQNIFVTYTAGFTAIPPDIYLAATKTVALVYMRKNWIGLVQKSMAQGAGTTSYMKEALEPDVMEVLSNYIRWTPV